MDEQQLVELVGNRLEKDVRYVHDSGQWFIWDEQRWRPASEAEIEEKVRAVLAELAAPTE